MARFTLTLTRQGQQGKKKKKTHKETSSQSNQKYDTCVDTDIEAVQGPCEKFPWQAGKCSLRICWHLLTGPRAEPGAGGIGPGPVGVRGSLEGSKRERSQLREAPLPGRFWSALPGPRRAPRVSFGTALYRAPSHGLQSQQCFTLAPPGACNLLWKCESRDVVPLREEK